MERGVEAQIGYLLDNQLIERISKNKLNINVNEVPASKKTDRSADF